MSRFKVKFDVSNTDRRRFVVSEIQEYLFPESTLPIKSYDFQSVFVSPEQALRWMDKFFDGRDAEIIEFEGPDENHSSAMSFLYHEFYVGGGSDPFYFLGTEPDFYGDMFFWDNREIEGWVFCKTGDIYRHNVPLEELDSVLDLVLEWYDLDGDYFHHAEDNGFAQHMGDVDVDICRDRNN